MSDEDGRDLGAPEYLGYRLIVKIKERSRRQISRSKFLKLNCIADNYLRNELGTDIRLPRYWYKYGEILDEQSINSEFYHAPSARGYSGQQYLTSRPYEEEEFNVDETTREKIKEAVEWTALRFAKRNAEQIKNHQYQVQAPKEFIRAYSELRELLDVSNIGEQAVLKHYSSGESDKRELVLDLLDEMLITYPVEDYDSVYDLYLLWDDTARLILEKGPDYDALNRFLDEFIECLSKNELRFEHSSNLPPRRLQRWEQEKDDVVAEFESVLRKRREILLKVEAVSGELEKVAEEYDKAVENIMSRFDDND